MGQFFPDFAQSARLGFQSGREMADGSNPLGNFVRMMLADWQQRRAVGAESAEKDRLLEKEYGLKRGLMHEEISAKSEADKQTLQQIIGQGASPQGGGFQLTKIIRDGLTLENPELQAKLKQQEQELSPLSGDTAARYSGATQGLQNINEIRNELSKYKGNESEARKIVKKANYSVEASQAKPTFIPGLQAGFRRYKENRAGDVGAGLGNKFLTLAENLLRARTGATAPEPEVVREEARTLFNQFFESPKTWEEKLKNNELYLSGVADEIRPLRKDKHIIRPKKYIRTGTDSITGKRIGMLEDGTQEEIR